MINLLKNIKQAKKSNLLTILEDKKDLELLDFLNLNKKIKEKLESTLDKDENKFFQFFIGEENFEYLYVFIYKNKKEDFYYFTQKNITNIENKFTIFAKNDFLIKLLNSSILSRYKFNKYKTDEKEKKQDEIFIIVNNDIEELVKDRIKTLENIILARDLGETPANDLTPEKFANIIKNTNFINTKVKILSYEDIQEKGMGLLEAVGKGSKNKPRVVILERIVDEKLPILGIVGKGITFDTGGIQVKPGDYMYEMKGDMCGAGTLFALMKELDRKELKNNIVACLVLAENHISGESYKPSDIIKSYSGKTVDIIHTDAEGRLALADGVSYVSKNYKPSNLITIATLTGACMVALGFRYAGIMGNDENLINKFLDYSKKNFEKYNRLPFDDYFIEKTKSKIADLENLNKSVYAGSTMGAAFLYNFLMNNEKYTHIDIAGIALNSYEPYGLANKGMTGFGVDSISKILQNF